jgi:hypothetical protein
VLQTVRSGAIVITLSSPSGAMRQGDNAMQLEFRSAAGNLVDVGTVRLGATMAMPGMVMPGTTRVLRTDVNGVYEVMGQFAMAGTWQFTVEWDGPAGRGSAAFDGAVQ